MNLWLRLFVTVLTFRLRGRRGLFETTTLDLCVLPNDLDFNGHVNNGRYLTLADLARMDYVLRSGAARVAIAHRALPIVGDVTAKFRRELRLFERYTIKTRLLGWHEKWTFMEHVFVCKGRVVGVVVMRGLFRAPSGPVSPEVFSRALGALEPSPTLPDWVIAWSRACDALSMALREDERGASATGAHRAPITAA